MRTRPRLTAGALAGALALAVLVALVLRAGTGVAATTPSTIARGLPAGAVAYLETPRLRELLVAWHDGRVARSFDGSAADEDMRRGMLWLRLGERLAALEQLGGFELTHERALLLFGREAGVAVYDLAETRFVLATRLGAAEMAKTPIAAARARFASRRHAGLEFFVHEKKGEATLAFAFVGDRLLVGNDLPRFCDALLLTAREARVKHDAKAAVPAALADDAEYAGLVTASPPDASLRVYVRLAAIQGTHHFDDFWIFNWASPDGASRRQGGVLASMLSLQLRGGGATETRVHRLADARVVAGKALPTPDRLPGGGSVGTVDVAAAGAGVLPAGLLATVEDADALLLAARVFRLLPSVEAYQDFADEAAPAATDAAGGARADLAAALQTAGAGRFVEIVSLDARLRRGGALAVRLAEPAKLDLAAVERALRVPLTATFGSRVRLGFVDAPAAPAAAAAAPAAPRLRTLAIPLVAGDDYALTVVAPRPGAPYLIIATSAAAAGELARELARAPVSRLLDPDAPLVFRVDVAAAAARWKGVTAALAGAPWPSTDAARLVGEVVPALFAATGIGTVTGVAYRVRDYRVEQVDFLW